MEVTELSLSPSGQEPCESQDTVPPDANPASQREDECIHTPQITYSSLGNNDRVPVIPVPKVYLSLQEVGNHSDPVPTPVRDEKDYVDVAARSTPAKDVSLLEDDEEGGETVRPNPAHDDPSLKEDQDYLTPRATPQKLSLDLKEDYLAPQSTPTKVYLDLKEDVDADGNVAPEVTMIHRREDKNVTPASKQGQPESTSNTDEVDRSSDVEGMYECAEPPATPVYEMAETVYNHPNVVRPKPKLTPKRITWKRGLLYGVFILVLLAMSVAGGMVVLSVLPKSDSASASRVKVEVGTGSRSPTLIHTGYKKDGDVRYTVYRAENSFTQTQAESYCTHHHDKLLNFEKSPNVINNSDDSSWLSRWIESSG